MNIFCPHSSPVKSAYALDVRRDNKMIVESAQLLSTAVAILRPDLADDFYKISYKNHPCAIAVRQHRGTFLWVVKHALALNELTSQSRDRAHKSSHVVRAAGQIVDELSFDYDDTFFPNCTPVHSGSDIHDTYRRYLCQKWRDDQASGYPPRWRCRITPAFYEAYTR